MKEVIPYYLCDNIYIQDHSNSVTIPTTQHKKYI